MKEGFVSYERTREHESKKQKVNGGMRRFSKRYKEEKDAWWKYLNLLMRFQKKSVGKFVGRKRKRQIDA